ncbi:PAS domain S-box protein [Hymenobacter sp. BT491]|uniref:sensor histidine kinase n=1 Tax=Hymenobacter sp. BT491 TaxID=2766779 RepID=UPI001653615A|nr:PAS domain S-box protein [Hymenobacter sp. BT491]MBC6989536.1 PAS domain S-box protein [Hymenobacter sp. BT491]
MSESHFESSTSLHDALEQLRARADRRRHLVTQVVDVEHSSMDVQRLVQELQVHQIELEMQYEELLRAQAETEALRMQYVDLYDFAPVGYFTLDAHGLIQQLNICASQQLGTVRQRLQGRRFALFVAPAHRLLFNLFLAKALTADHRQTCEVEMLREDGKSFFAQLEALATPSLDPDQPSQHCRVAVIDITARRKATEDLRASEARFRRLFEQSNDAVLLLRNERYIDCNDAALHLLGASDKSHIIGQPAWAHCPVVQPNGMKTKVLFQESIQRAKEVGSERCEVLMHRSLGEEIWVESVITLIQDADEEILIHMVWRNVTAQKRERQLREASEEDLRLALEASNAGVWSWEFSSDELRWDERAQASFGLALGPGPVPFNVLQQAIHPDDLPTVTHAFQRSIKQRTPFELDHRVLWPDGSVHFVSARGKVFYDEAHKPVRFTGLMRDETSQREAEEDLRYQHRLLGRILQNLPVVLLRLSPEGEILEMSGAGLQRMGSHDNEARGANIYEAFPMLTEPIRALLGGEPVTFIGHYDLNGYNAFYQNFGFFDEQKGWGVLFSIDITDSEISRHHLREEKEFSRSLLDNSIDALVALDCNACITAWNRVATSFANIPEAQALGQSVYDIYPQFNTDEGRAIMQRVMAGEEVQLLGYRFLSRPGFFDAYLTPLKGQDDAVTGTLITIRDVTERNRMEEENTRLKLRQQQEVLSAIMSTQEAERKRISEALHNGVGQLLYATKLHIENHSSNIQKHTAALALLEEAITATRNISFELTPGVLEDFGLKSGLQELVKRIPKTSLDVHLHLVGLSKKRPKLIETAIYRMVQELLNNIMKHAQAKEVFVHVVHEDHQVLISVEDDGVGFEVREDVPMRGIGLAGIRNRVDLLGGTLTIDSRPGRGTIVSIEITLKKDKEDGKKAK